MEKEWNFYVLDDNCVARMRDVTGVWDVATNGRWVPDESQAMQEAREMFEMKGIPHQLPGVT